MSLCDRRFILTGAAAVLAAGCGFQPMHGAGGPAAGLYGRIALAEAVDPVSFAYRERMRRLLGDGASAAWRLESRIEIRETGVAVTPASDITRYRLAGLARYRLIALADGRVALEGEIPAETRFDATSGPYATRRARDDAERRLARTLAERAAARILAAGERLGGAGS